MRYFKEFYRFIKHILSNRYLLFSLIKDTFKKQYLGSYLGILWAFIQPIAFITVIWFVFQIGFKVNPTTNGTPFFLWLICGLIPWFFFSNAISSGTHSITNNSFLVKKVSFRVSILPIVQIFSDFIIHLCLVVLLISCFLFYGYQPDIYWLQLPFFIISSLILIISISWFTSAIKVFIKDIGQFISVLLQMGFWFTPIFWSTDLIPKKYLYIIQLNPMYFIVNGYRDTFINKVWFWEQEDLTLYFLMLTTITFFIAAITFKRLRPHFGDVL